MRFAVDMIHRRRRGRLFNGINRRDNSMLGFALALLLVFSLIFGLEFVS